MLNKNIQNDEEKSIADILVELSSKYCSYFINEIDEGYATVEIDGHRSILKLTSRRFSKLLIRLYYESTGKTVKLETLKQAVSLLEVMATYSGNRRNLERRVSLFRNSFYYDLADDANRAIKVSVNGCEIDPKPPILFVKGANMKAQIMPNLKSDPKVLLKMIDSHFRFIDKFDRMLFACYLISCLVPGIPHPILVLFGEKGAAKTTSMRLIRSIIDPAKHDRLSLPLSKTDLAISLSNNYMPSFDNLDLITAEKSDMLCMASTGGAFTKRTLYTDEDETIISFKRCVILNGINVVATRPDLLDRSIILELERISPEERRTEEAVLADFKRDKPLILGACFNTLARAISIKPEIRLSQLGRMADFTIWGYAIAESLGIGGDQFLKAYLNNQKKSNEEAISSNPLAVAILAFMRNKTEWKGSVAELLCTLESIACEERINTNNKLYPKAAHVLSMRLKEIKSNLEQAGIHYDIRHAGKNKQIYLSNNQSVNE